MGNQTSKHQELKCACFHNSCRLMENDSTWRVLRSCCTGMNGDGRNSHRDGGSSGDIDDETALYLPHKPLDQFNRHLLNFIAGNSPMHHSLFHFVLKSKRKLIEQGRPSDVAGAGLTLMLTRSPHDPKLATSLTKSLVLLNAHSQKTTYRQMKVTSALVTTIIVPEYLSPDHNPCSSTTLSVICCWCVWSSWYSHRSTSSRNGSSI